MSKFIAGLPIRRKLIIFHNLFFLILVLSLYFALRTPLTQIAARSAQQEAELLAQVFERYPGAVNSVQSDRFTILDDKDAELIITPEIRDWLRSNPGRVWRDRVMIQSSAIPTFRLIRLDTTDNTYQVIALNAAQFVQLSRRLRWMLGLALLTVYALAVIALEMFILPRYVYHPLQRILRADEALQSDVRERELIEARHISGDELGQIMTSRNATVKLLRQHEDQLKTALDQVEEMANDLKRKNHLLETAKQNLASQDRLVSLGLMSAGVAHEINTPLAVLHGSLEKMIETCHQPGNEAHHEERLQRMLRVTERLRGISESLTDFARARTQTMEAVKIKPLLDEAWALVSIEARKLNIEFINHATENDVVIGNAGRLLQVFVNLFKNGVYAIKDRLESGHANGASGKVCVHTSRVLQDEKPWLQLTVEDNGAGIPPDVLPRIFEPFVTSRLDANGTGLGLAVTAGIVDQHGGLIVASNRATGAQFEITLPMPT
ncbi:MAG TPA: ATP-binding protein [Blastocatellia bacterium]|nr:ATP-binding protein [Blastocatellia bacterium]